MTKDQLVRMQERPFDTETKQILAKIANTTFGFFQSMGTSPIFPQGGTYTAPVAGDIVYFQHDTFPPELGLVTNATLTSGTFAVNNFTSSV